MTAQIIVPAKWDAELSHALSVNQQRPVYTAGKRKQLVARIKRLLREQDAVLVAHYYTDPDIQRIADETGGHVADSLDMAEFGHEHEASTLVVAGVRFMGETAKILNPEKRVLMPTLEANCSLDLSCPAERFAAFCDQHPDRTVVVYANTSAEVKARADWVVTSGIALKIVTHLKEQGKKILWAPDRYLGHYVKEMSGADILLWQGACVVHEAFKAEGLDKLRGQYTDAAILVHPESPPAVIALADVVGSTTRLIQAARELPNQTFIVATDKGIFYKMKQAAPGKTFLEAPSAGIGATCQSCAHCPWMEMNHLGNLAAVLETGANEVHVAPDVREKALRATERMLNFAKQAHTQVLGYGNA